LYPSNNLVSDLPSLSSLYPSSSLSHLPDISTLLKSGQPRPFQEPLQLPLSGNSLSPSSLGGVLSSENPALPSLLRENRLYNNRQSVNEDRRNQLLQLLKLRSERIATLQRAVEQGQATTLKQQRDLSEWIAAQKQKSDSQMALQKNALKNEEQELEGLVQAQQVDINELNSYNAAIKKAYIDSGLQLQHSRLANAKVEEAKQKEEYEQSQKLRKEIERQVAALTKDLRSVGNKTAQSTQSIASVSTSSL